VADEIGKAPFPISSRTEETGKTIFPVPCGVQKTGKTAFPIGSQREKTGKAAFPIVSETDWIDGERERIDAKAEGILRIAELARSRRRLADELDEIARHCSRLPVLDSRTPDEILGYDEHGLPR
jgi:hypothetical protein